MGIAAVGLVALLGRKLNPRWRYAILLMVLLRFILPVSLSSPFSVFGLFSPQPKKTADATTQIDLGGAPTPTPNAVEKQTPGPSVAKTPQIESSSTNLLPFALLFLWLAGVTVQSLRSVLCYFRLRRSGRTIPTDSPLYRLLEECKSEAGVRRKIELVENSSMGSVGLLGLFRVRLVFPAGVEEQFSEMELRRICRHELTHVRSGDLWINGLVGVLEAVHWFNPVLRWFFGRLRLERELACDSMVLRHASELERVAYGETLLKAVEHWSSIRQPTCLVAVLGGPNELRERICAVRDGAGSKTSTALGMCCVALLAISCLTDPKRTSGLASVDPSLPMRSYVIYESALLQGVGKNQRIVPKEKWEQLVLTKKEDLDILQAALSDGFMKAAEFTNVQRKVAYQNNHSGKVRYSPGEGVLVVYAPTEEQELIQKQILLWTEVPNRQPRILIASKFVETTESAARSLYQFMLNPQTPGTCQTNAACSWPVGLEEKWRTNSAEYFRANGVQLSIFAPVAVLSSARFASVLDWMKKGEGTDILSSPKVTTVSGTQARISVQENRSVIEPGGLETNMILGPSLDVNQTVEFSGTRSIIDVTPTFTVSEFMGYSDEARLKEFSPTAKPAQRMPVFRLRQSTSKARLYQQQTLVVGGRSRTASPNAKQTKDDKNFILVFLTISLIHTDGEPFSKESVGTFPE